MWISRNQYFGRNLPMFLTLDPWVISYSCVHVSKLKFPNLFLSNHNKSWVKAPRTSWLDSDLCPGSTWIRICGFSSFPISPSTFPSANTLNHTHGYPRLGAWGQSAKGAQWIQSPAWPPCSPSFLDQENESNPTSPTWNTSEIPKALWDLHRKWSM